MITKNFQTGFQGSSSYVGGKRMDGSDYTNIPLVYLGNVNPGGHYCSTGSSNFHVMIGSGTTPPTINDYDLADTSIIAGDKMRSTYQSASSSKNDGVVVATQWENASNEPITIKEVGLVYKADSPSYTKSANVLIARKVLQTPITIQPAEVYIFSYCISV